MARKTTHERYLGRSRSSQSDKLPMNGGQARTPSDRVVAGGTSNGPQSVRNRLLFVILSGTIDVWRLECCLRHIGRWQAGRGVDGTTASARGVPRSAPRSNPRLGGLNTCLAPYFNILTFSDASFCSSQLASSSVVPRGLLPMRFGVIVRLFHVSCFDPFWTT